MKESTGKRYRDVLRQRDFRLLLISFLVDQIGSWSFSVVLVVEVYERTHSTFYIAALSACRWIPGLLLSGYGGVIADRYERTRVMIISALGSAVVMAVIAVAFVATWPVWTLLVLNGLTALTGAPYRPAAGALTPEIVDEAGLASANALYSTLESLVVVLGPAFGGLLLLTGAHVTGVIINTATFLVAAALIQRLRVRSTGGAERGGKMLAQWVEGLRALVAARIAFVLVIFCALDSAVYGASTVVFAPLSSVRLGTGVDGYSYLLAGAALGGVLAAALANRLSASTHLAPVIVISITVEAVPFALTNLTHTPAVAFVLQVISGAGMIIVDVLAITALQRDLDRGVLSRVLGVFDAAILAATAAASFAAAAVFRAEGLSTTLIAIGIFFPVAALLGLPTLLRGDRQTAQRARDLAPIADLLGSLDLFAGASRSVLEGLAADAEEMRVPARTIVIREGDTADNLYVLAEGSLTVRAKGDRQTAKQLPTVNAPAYVGELGLIHKVPRTATVRAREDSTLLRIDGEQFLSAMETAPTSSAFVRLTGVRLARTAPSTSTATAAPRKTKEKAAAR
jgi:CRP-like cAMP-binding protein/predicted MFS family arabinose efflux permease